MSSCDRLSQASYSCCRSSVTEQGRIVGLREAGRHIDGLLHMLGTMYRWCVVAFSSVLWNTPSFVDQVPGGRIVQTHVKIDVLCEQRWPLEQHSGKISGHMLHLLCHQGPSEPSACSRTQITCASGQATTYTTTPPITATLVPLKCHWRVEWRSVVFSGRVGSICMRVIDVHVYGRDQVSVIFRSAFAHDTPHLMLHGMGSHQLYLAVTFSVSAG